MQKRAPQVQCWFPGRRWAAAAGRLGDKWLRGPSLIVHIISQTVLFHLCHLLSPFFRAHERVAEAEMWMRDICSNWDEEKREIERRR
jgi:hypothetical protein